MHRAAARRHNYHRSHRHHRQQDGDRSSDEDSSNSGSSEEESISPSSSASISSSTSAEGEESESDREEFVQEVLSFSDSEESSEEECVEDNILSPSSSSGSESDEDSDVDSNSVALEQTIKMLQNLRGNKLLQVQQFIRSLDAIDTPKPVPRLVKVPLPKPTDLSQQSITPSTISSLGLGYVGFSTQRQASARETLNTRRFISFYGAPPQALAPLFRDIRDMFKAEFPSCEDLFMTLNWLKCYDVMHVMEGRWGYCEDYMRPIIKQCQEMMQALRRKNMKFVASDTIIAGSLDTVSFLVQEFRQEPSAKWYDQKSKSAGLKYEFCVGTEEPAKQVWFNGPFPCGEIADVSIYRGGDEKTAKKDRNKKALYFQMPKGKKLAADSAYAGEYDRIIVTMPGMDEKEIKWLNRLKARGETLHGRLKSFRVLGTRFRHGKGTQDKLNRHQMATESVCLIVLYDCENGRPLFDQ